MGAESIATESIATGLVVSISVAWIAWISLSTIQNQRKIDKLSSLSDQYTDIKGDIVGLSDRLDIFIKSELDTLKQIAKQ